MHACMGQRTMEWMKQKNMLLLSEFLCLSSQIHRNIMIIKYGIASTHMIMCVQKLVYKNNNSFTWCGLMSSICFDLIFWQLYFSFIANADHCCSIDAHFSACVFSTHLTSVRFVYIILLICCRRIYLAWKWNIPLVIEFDCSFVFQFGSI